MENTNMPNSGIPILGESRKFDMEYTETINGKNGENILKMTNDEIIKYFFDSDEIEYKNENEILTFVQKNAELQKPQDVKVYIKGIRKYIAKALKNENKTLVKYKQSGGGRVYQQNKYSLQNMQGNLRNYLLSDIQVYDYDMKAAHVKILRFLSSEYNDISTVYLDNYINSRSDVFDKFNINKTDVLSTMNIDKFKGNNIWLKNFHNEICQIHKKIVNDKKYINFETINKKNPRASRVNKILCHFENKILQDTIADYKEHVTTLIFDGFHCTNELDLEKLDSLNDMDVKWVIKPINSPDIPIIDSEYLTYAEAKGMFEKTCFKISNPSKYVWIDDKNEAHFKDEKEIVHIMLDRIPKYRDDEGEEREFKSFLYNWKKDPEKRQFETLDFDPKLPPYDNETIYNTWSGLKCVKTDEKVDTQIIHEFLKSLSNEEGVYDYLLKYIAQLVQEPWKNPNVAILLRGLQGTGKDSFIELCEKLIGEKYVEKNTNAEDVQNRFNSTTSKKLIVQVDEVDSKDVRQNKLKTRITAPKNRIERKGVDAMFENNYVRYIFMTNSLYAMNLDSDDRRFMSIQTNFSKKGDTEFWKSFYDSLNTDEIMNSFYTELCEIDISKFHPANDRPYTSQRRVMTENAIRPQHQFLYETIIEEETKEKNDNKYVPYEYHTFRALKDKNYISFSYTEFRDELIIWYKHKQLDDRDGKEYDPKHIKVLLYNAGLNQKSIRMEPESCPTTRYIMDIKNTKAFLELAYPHLVKKIYYDDFKLES